MKKYFLFLLVVILITSCSTITIPKQPFVYSYRTQQKEKLSVSVALNHMIYSQESMEYLKKSAAIHFIDPIKEFGLAFSRTINDLLIDKGINTKSYFNNIDEMTFIEKKESDLYLIPILDLKYFVECTKEDRGISAMFGVTYTFQIMISGSINLEINEPLTKEKLWKKQIQFPAISKETEIKASSRYDQNINNQIYNIVSELLVNFYQTNMPTVDKYLSGDELKYLKNETEDLRKNKKF